MLTTVQGSYESPDGLENYFVVTVIHWYKANPIKGHVPIEIQSNNQTVKYHTINSRNFSGTKGMSFTPLWVATHKYVL